MHFEILDVTEIFQMLFLFRCEFYENWIMHVLRKWWRSMLNSFY